MFNWQQSSNVHDKRSITGWFINVEALRFGQTRQEIIWIDGAEECEGLKLTYPTSKPYLQPRLLCIHLLSDINIPHCDIMSDIIVPHMFVAPHSIQIRSDRHTFAHLTSFKVLCLCLNWLALQSLCGAKYAIAPSLTRFTWPYIAVNQLLLDIAGIDGVWGRGFSLYISLSSLFYSLPSILYSFHFSIFSIISFIVEVSLGNANEAVSDGWLCQIVGCVGWLTV